MPQQVTEPYRLVRTQVAVWGAREYLRRLWWAFVAIPITGVILLIFGGEILKVIGLMAVLWPITIPGRSMLATRGVARRLTLPTQLFRDEQALYFATEPRDRSYRLPIERIRAATLRSDALVIEAGPLQFVFVPLKAFASREDAEGFARSILGDAERLKQELSSSAT